MADNSLMTIQESILDPEVSMSNVQDVRAISTTGKSVRVAKANVRYPATQITVSQAGIAATEVQAALHELDGEIDTLGTTKENTANKKTVINDSDTEFPTSKAVNTLVKRNISAAISATLTIGASSFTFSSGYFYSNGTAYALAGQTVNWLDAASTQTLLFNLTTATFSLSFANSATFDSNMIICGSFSPSYPYSHGFNILKGTPELSDKRFLELRRNITCSISATYTYSTTQIAIASGYVFANGNAYNFNAQTLVFASTSPQLLTFDLVTKVFTLGTYADLGNTMSDTKVFCGMISPAFPEGHTIPFIKRGSGTNGKTITELLAESDTVYLEPRAYTVDSTIVIPSGKKLIGVRGKTILNVAAGVTVGLSVYNVNDVHIEGLTIVGVYPNVPEDGGMNPVLPGVVDTFMEAVNEKDVGMVSGVSAPQIGIKINTAEKIEVYGCEIKNFSSYGINVVASGKNYRYAIRIENNWINNCYCGIKTEQEAERSNYFANVISLCQIGMYVDSGTNLISGCSMTSNRVGMVLGDGANHAHGHITDCPYSHNSLYAIVAYQVQYGQVFNGCKLGYCALYMYNSRGIFFQHGEILNTQVYCDGMWIDPADSVAKGINAIMGNNVAGLTVYRDYLGHTSPVTLRNNINIDGSDNTNIND